MSDSNNFLKFLFPKILWRTIRLHKIIKQHKQVADFWNPIIDSYFEGKIEKYAFAPKQQFDDQKIIWQYWGQGVDDKNLPEIVDICFKSVDAYKGDYRVIRLNDDTVKEYIDLPDFVVDKLQKSTFTRTFFSDLLRVILLNSYGGVWLDATVLLTDKFPEKYENLDFFMFQRSDEEKHKQYWENVYAYYFCWHPRFKVRMLSSALFAKKGSVVITALQDLMLYYWKTQNQLSDYFAFQILFNELISGKLSAVNCPIVNDCIPHIIQTKINGTYDYISFEEAMRLTSIHKMTYFDDEAIIKLKGILYQIQ